MHRFARGQNGRPVQGVFKLPHVARPVVIDQRAHGSLRNLADRLLKFVADRSQEMKGECGNVVASISQGRRVNREDVDAVIQVLSEATFGYHSFEVLVGGRDEPHVGLLHYGAAHRPELALLNDAQQLGLRRQGDVAKFIQKKSAVVGDFEHTTLVRHRSGERSFGVTKEFAFEQVLAQRIAIDGHKRLVLAQAVVVNGAGNHFLAGATFPGNQNRCAGWRALGNQGIHRLHRCARPDDVFKMVLGTDFLLERAVLLHQTPAFQRAINHVL